MRYVVTAAEMRALDAATIGEIGLPGAVLMENAGRAVAEVARRELGGGGGEVAVVCGAGNNGGDGYVIARWLREAGIAATVYLAAERGSIRGDAALHLKVFEGVGGTVRSIATAEGLAAEAAGIERAALVVDALLGVGLARPVTGQFAAVIEAMNRSRGRRLAVDVPSGLDSDSGAVLGVAVAADVTVTVAFAKTGLATGPGLGRAGRIEVVDIGIPRELAATRGAKCAQLERHDVALLVPRTSANDYKNSRGHLLVIAGSPGKRGAARLAATGAMRAGAGLVTIASPWGGAEVVAPDPVMTAELDPEDAKGLEERVAALVAGKRAVAIGPGMPTGDGGRRLVEALLARTAGDVPIVLDADALNHLAGRLEAVAAAAAPAVLTPHPGEAGRLLGVSGAEIERDRVAAVRTLAARSGAVVLLKGAGTLVCDGRQGEGFVTVNPTGGPWLATAGSGDVLTGIIGALLAQGLDVAAAARLGAWLHGAAGDRAAAERGSRGVMASDLPDSLGVILDELRR